MKLPFGFSLSLTRKNVPAGYQSLESTRSWYRIISEPFSGAWQRNIVLSNEDVLTFAANYACVTLKSTDISKLRIKQIRQSSNGVWEETFDQTAYTPVLRKPNHYQTRQQFVESWMLSKFVHGNTYVLLKRNSRGGEGQGNVEAMYVLDPSRVSVKVAPNGDVYYGISSDNLSRTDEAVIVPARDIIHDVMSPLYHPLCGVSPLSACALAATQGLRVQRGSEAFFGNGSVPSGIVTLPDEIDEDQAKDYRARWEENFSGINVGRVAVLGAGTTFVPMTMRAVDAQLIEQLKWTAENCCTAHHVPPFKVGVGPMPAFNNVEALNQQYYSEALQSNIEALEALLDEKLGLPKDLGIELDLDGLFRADTVQRTTAAEKAVRSGMTINEARRRFFDLGPKTGGDSPLIQQQNYSIEALAKRDASDDPFGTKTPPAPAPAPSPANDPKPDPKAFAEFISKGYRETLAAA